ncbi:MAG: hypothetical protein WD991_01945 [Candidatus Paceibacterota bacterium]
MITPELLTYVRGELAKGSPKELILKALTDAGWAASDAEEAFASIAAPMAPITPVAPMTPATRTVSQEPIAPVSIATPIGATNIMSNANTHGHKSKMGLLLSVVLLALLGGGAGYAYYAGYLPSSSVSVTQVMANVMEAKSVKFDTTLGVKMNYSDPKEASEASPLGLDFDNMIFRASGASETSSAGSKSDALFSVKFGNVGVTVELRVLDEVAYFRLVEVPDLGMDLSEFRNKWFSFSEEDITKSISSSPFGPMPYNYPNLTEAQTTQIIEITKNASLIKILGKNGTDTLEGVNTTRYLFDLDRPGILAYLMGLQNFLKTLPEETGAIMDLRAEDIEKELNKIQNFQGEIWVGTKDQLPYKLTVVFSSPIVEREDEVGKVDMNLVLLLDDWNQLVVVEKPEGAENFMDFINRELQTAMTLGDDAYVKAVLSNMRTQAELYYDTEGFSYEGFCESPVALAEIKRINKENNSKSIICRDNESQFLAASPLSDGSYHCVSDAGATKSISKAPTGMVCQ